MGIGVIEVGIRDRDTVSQDNKKEEKGKDTLGRV